MPREIVVRRPATIGLLAIATVCIIAITLWMSGKSYRNLDPVPFENLRYLANRFSHRPISTDMVAVIVVPMIANVLLFLPWGFLLFLCLYSIERPTLQTYVLTTLLGISFSLAIEAWQYFLPDRVADVNDVIWNSCGALAGAILGHLRLRVRFEFE